MKSMQQAVTSSWGVLWLAFQNNMQQLGKWLVRGSVPQMKMDARWMKEHVYNSGKQ